MSKKLVKTAKQQFEERLRELHTLMEQVIDKDMHFYGCMDVDADFYVLYSDADKEFYECRYGRQFEDVIQSEEFLLAMVRRFDEGARKMRPLFEWYASADHEINEAAPLDLRDVANIGIEKEFITFQDVEIEMEAEEDDPYATAKEQALRDIKKYGLNKEFDEANGEYFCGDVDGKFVIIVIYSECEPCRYEFAKSREEMYRDKDFQSSIMKCFSSVRGSDEVLELFEWTKDTTKQEPFDLYEIINAVELHGGPAICVCYEGKPNPIKQDFKEEIDALRTKMVKYIIELCEQGMTVNFEALCKNCTIAFVDGSFDYTENLEEFYLMKHTQEPYWRYIMRDSNGEYDGRLGLFTIETLQHIIESMQ